MRKFLLTGSIILVFSLYVWRAGASPAPLDINAPVIVPDRRVLPMPQDGQPQPVAESPASPAAAAPAASPADSPAASPTSAPAPAPAPAPVRPAPAPRGMYRDGTYRGTAADAYYGYIQVNGVIRGGKLADVQMLDYPNDRSHSIQINSYALPILISEAVRAQSADVDIVSGATDTSMAFRESLASALALARN